MLTATALSAQAQTQPALNPPLMGWSSWNTYAANINASVIKRQASAMVARGLKDCGYQYINIDDGFQWDRDEKGNLQINPNRFPEGLAPIVEYIHGKGLKAGIYSDAGHSTCANYYGGEDKENDVGLLDHDDDDCKLFFNDLKFDFIKVDFCGGTSWQNHEKLDLDAKKRYVEIAEAIKKTGCEVNYNVCRWDFPGTWVCDIADSWRISQDINASWNSVSNIIKQNLYLSAYCGGGHYNDMDMLEVGRGLSLTEDRTHFGMWCIMSSPLLIGCDMSAMSSQTLNLLKNKELIALNQDPLGLQAYVVDNQKGVYTLVKDIEELNGLKRAVAVYNSTDAASQVEVSFANLDLSGKVKVRDIINKKDTEESGSMIVKVPAHGSAFFTVEAEQRMMRTLYEAETAWLSSYQELANNQSAGTAVYSESTSCSGGMKVGWLGKKAANDLQWRNVYVAEEGDYEMTLTAVSGESRKVNVSVNGGAAKSITCNSGSWDKPKDFKLTVHLSAGNNVVRLYNASAWMPDIDCMRLAKKVPTSVDGVAASRRSSGAVYAVGGQVIRQRETSSASSSLQGLPAGLYVSDGRKVVKE